MPAPRRTKRDEEEQEEVKQDAVQDMESMNQRLHDLHNDARAAKVLSSYLLSQHADQTREKAKKEMVVGGWTMFQASTEDFQSDSRERWIKEVAKKPGIPNSYYRDWVYSHQKRGDSLSAITVVTVTKPWQRSEMLDYMKNIGTTALKERFYIDGREETSWEKILAKFGVCNDSDNRQKDIKIRPKSAFGIGSRPYP